MPVFWLAKRKAAIFLAVPVFEHIPIHPKLRFVGEAQLGVGT